MSYAPILFDLDGTLVDSVVDLATGINLVRRALGDDSGCTPTHRVDNATELLQVLR